MKPINISTFIKKYKGLWIALTENNTVISANKSVRQVVKEAKKKGYLRHTLFKVPTEDIPFIG